MVSGDRRTRQSKILVEFLCRAIRSPSQTKFVLILGDIRPLGDKDARLEKIIVDFLCCAIGNPEIDNLMLIVGDLSGHSEFELAAHLIEMSKFHCFLSTASKRITTAT